MATVGAKWVRPGVKVRDPRFPKSLGVVVAIFAGSPWVAWNYLQPAPGLHRAMRCSWRNIEPALTLVKGGENDD